MKYSSILLFFFLSFKGFTQTHMDWQFRYNSIYASALDKYLESTDQWYRNSINYNPKLPLMGIYLIDCNMDSTRGLETLTIRFCLDESWRDQRFDTFSFSGPRLFLINRRRGSYLSEEVLEKLIQDRVFSWEKKEIRMVARYGANSREEVNFEEEKYDKWATNSPLEAELTKAPYYLRKLRINHNDKSIKIIYP